jgi:hypothetical protein
LLVLVRFARVVGCIVDSFEMELLTAQLSKNLIDAKKGGDPDEIRTAKYALSEHRVYWRKIRELQSTLLEEDDGKGTPMEELLNPFEGPKPTMTLKKAPPPPKGKNKDRKSRADEARDDD